MKFKKYTDIDNYYDKQVKNYLLDSEMNDIIWVATNKIDGSNFSFWYDKKEIRHGKRSCLLGGDCNFSNYLSFAEKYEEDLKQIYKNLNLNDGDIITLFGEVFGGTYPHDDVEKVKNSTKILGRIFYIPFNDFICFDIMINEEYISYSDMIKALEGTKLKTTTLIKTGTLNDLINMDVEFEDPTYLLYGLPKIEGNMSEGVVIKPRDAVLKNDFGSRLIFKKKAPKFSEKMKHKTKKQIVLSDEDIKQLHEIEEYITESRLCSVISKDWSEPTFKDFTPIMSAYVADVYKDFEKDTGINILKLNNKVITKGIVAKCSNILREYLKRY